MAKCAVKHREFEKVRELLEQPCQGNAKETAKEKLEYNALFGDGNLNEW